MGDRIFNALPQEAGQILTSGKLYEALIPSAAKNSEEHKKKVNKIKV
jgi:hypothetical protein